MLKIILISFLFIELIVSAGDKNPVTEKITSDIEGILITITYDTNFSNSDYITETYTSFSDSGKYIIERGLDSGLIYFPCSGHRQKSYGISKDNIQRIIKTKYEMDVYDRTDFIFTETEVIIIHTTAGNAGIFTGSDVYLLPRRDTKERYMSWLMFMDEVCSVNTKLFMEVLDFCARHNIPI